MSFTDILEGIQLLIQSNPALSAFAQSAWGRSVSAEICYRHRKEIAFQTLPHVLITRPTVNDRKAVRSGREGNHVIRLYAGFLQNDPAAATLEQVRFEELIEDALTVGNPLVKLGALSAEVSFSANDEGRIPPAYFTVMELSVLFRR